MKLWKILISSGILLAAVAAGMFLYDIAYSQGSAASHAVHDLVVDNDRLLDNIAGTQDDYSRGYVAGKQEGFEAGVKASLGRGYTLRDPTYAEAMAFLKADPTDKNPYVANSYVCSHYSRDVINNAYKANLRAAFVELRYPFYGHTLIAFETVDRGLVYFEPQNDQEVTPTIGSRYYPWGTATSSQNPTFDNTIVDILVIW